METESPPHVCQRSPWCQSATYPSIPDGPYTPPGQPERDRAFWAAVTAETDLRALPAEHRDHWSVAWLFVQTRAWGNRPFFSLEPFQKGVPLGPLSTVQVYASDPGGEEHDPRAFSGWGGSRKTHGIGCQHSKSLEPGWHQLLPLEEFLPLLPQPHDLVSHEMFSAEYMAWQNQRDRWCSKCDGYAIRRFTDEQCAYYEAQVKAFRE
jgi:hypothetical protein